MNCNDRNRPEQAASRWPHRLAWVLACAAFAQICLGSLVSTYEAGMAVPDWPTTYGYWFWYPLGLWLAVWDLFLAHAHRMLAQVVGLIAVVLAMALWRLDRRKWMRWLAAAAVLGVIFQGTLGGLRVIFDQRLLAKVHGCTAPLVFGLCAALVILTSRPWRDRQLPQEHPAARRLQCLALAITAGMYLLIVLGAQLRHLPLDCPTWWFPICVRSALALASVLAAGMLWLLILVLRKLRDQRMIVRRAKLLAALFSVQLVLGTATWVTNYGWPRWFTDYLWPVEYTIVAEGPLQVWITTAHAALGSLSLAASLSLTLWSFRLLRGLSRAKLTRS